MSRGLQALFIACILVASTAMFAVAESRKLDRAPIRALVLSAGPAVAGQKQPAVFSPTCTDCKTRYARIEFRLGKPGPLVAWVVSPTGTVIRQIGSFRDVRHVALRWNGRNEQGAVVPDGSYRLRLKIAGALRTLPVFIVVDTRPQPFTATLSRRKIVPGGYTKDDSALVTWHSPVQLFHIRVVATSAGTTQTEPVFRHAKTGSVDWPRVKQVGGRYHRVQVADGAWRLQIIAYDQAGNRSAVGLGTVQVATPR